MRRRKLIGIGGAFVLAAATGCQNSAGQNSKKIIPDTIVLGFAQVGAEGSWRLANTRSVQDAARSADFSLQFVDAGGQQKNQIAAIRSFIRSKVHVIAFSPAVESGWDEVLKEAKVAGIPVILTDRLIKTADRSLYKSSLGADFIAEGNLAAMSLEQEFLRYGKPATVVEIRGLPGAAPTVQRAQGFAEIAARAARLRVRDVQSGDWSRASGRRAMQALLARNTAIDAVFAHNDDMGLGAVEALLEQDFVPGVDIKIATVDGTKAALQAVVAGRINYVVECSPFIGPKLMDLVEQTVFGSYVPERVVTERVVFDKYSAKGALYDRSY